MRDFRYAFRLLRKNPTFTLTAVLTLALCIGANTAIYSVVDAFLFRPLPYPEPDRLAMIATLRRGPRAQYEQTGQDGFSWQAVHQQARSIDVAVYGGSSGINFAGPQGAQYVAQQRVSAGFFRVLGVAPLVGREFSESEDRPGGAAVAVLSHELWRRAFHADAGVVGREIVVRGEPHTVVGVMPPGFRSIGTGSPVDLWTPLRASTRGEGGGMNYSIVARLRPGVSWTQGDAEMAAIGQGIVREWHLRPGQSARFHLIPLERGLSQSLRQTLLVLWAAVAAVLLIGCVNIAGLLLAGARARGRELATRIALGGGKAALVRQLLAESLLLAMLGGLAGIVLGSFALEGLKVLARDTLGTAQPIQLDARVLAATALVSLLTSLIFGLYPALATTRVDLRSALALGGGWGASGRRQGWASRALVVSEVALGLILLVGAGLLIRTFAHLRGLAPGFDSSQVITASLSLQDARYSSASKVNRLFEESLARIRGISGVQAAAVALSLPYQRALNTGFQRLDGPRASGQWEITNLTYVTPDYLQVLRIPLLRGRGFTAADRARTQPVALVNEAFVRRYLPEQEPVGSHLRLGTAGHEIVGVVGNVQEGRAGWGGFGPVAPIPEIYIPAAQTEDGFFQLVHTWFSPSWVVRTPVPLQAMTASLQGAVASVDPQLPFSSFRTMDEIRSRATAFERLESVLLSALAALALLLAAVGIYGLIANAVIERTRELGIRMALGASAAMAMRSVALPGVGLAVIGLLAGCILARGAAGLLRAMIWGVEPGDPVTFAAACAAILLVALLASLLPALRVTRIDPARTLRQE